MNPRTGETRLGRRHQRAEMLFVRGMYALARDEYAGLLEAATGHDAAVEADLRWRLAVCLASLGQADEADAIATEGIARPGTPDEGVDRLEAVRAYARLVKGDAAGARDALPPVVDRMRLRADRAGLAPALRWHALACLRLGALEPAFESAYCSLAETRSAGLDVDAGHAHGLLCVAFIQRAQYGAAMEHGRQALEIASRLGHQSGIVRHNLHLSIASRLAGELDVAAAHAMRALAAAEETDATNLVISARLAVGRAMREAGRLDNAREMTQAALRIASSSQRERDHVLVLEDLGDLDVLSGNVRSALEKFRLAWRKAESIAAEGDLVAELGWRIGEGLLALGDVEGASPWIERSLAVAAKAGERKEQALALRARARLHARAGRDAEARRDLEESLTLLEALGVPYERARTHLAWDEALRVAGSETGTARAERRRHLAAARRLFERIGAVHGVHLAEQAEVALAAEETDAAVAPVAGPGAPPRGARALAVDWPSPAFRAALDECRKLGPTSLPLLLVGATGTGKTLLAEALHALGRGDEGEFFPVNCAALPHALQESELFGHRRGAFTGADRDHPGIFREAGRGTVFLDEIDKTSREFQAKLLHVLDNREIRPVGSTRRVAVEARIVCATNRDLFELVRRGEFLEDLHHRLMSGILQVPALRDRIEDLRPLSLRLLEEICTIERTAVPAITDDAWDLLTHHAWPGNVRELKSLLHRAVALNRHAGTLDAATFLRSAPVGSTLNALGGRMAGAQPGPAAARGRRLDARLENAEREEILRALEQADFVRKRAAETLGITYRGLNKKMARLGIEVPKRPRRT